MTTVQKEKIARRKLSLLQLAQELGNVSKAYVDAPWWASRFQNRVGGSLVRYCRMCVYGRPR